MMLIPSLGRDIESLKKSVLSANLPPPIESLQLFPADAPASVVVEISEFCFFENGSCLLDRLEIPKHQRKSKSRLAYCFRPSQV
jgi:hypothetical protein